MPDIDGERSADSADRAAALATMKRWKYRRTGTLPIRCEHHEQARALVIGAPPPVSPIVELALSSGSVVSATGLVHLRHVVRTPNGRGPKEVVRIMTI